MSKSPILLVDNDDRTRVLHAGWLRRAGYRVVERGDASSLVELVIRERPSVVLLEISMPGVNGLEACTGLRADLRCAGQRVLMLTSHDSFEAVRRATEAGADGFLCKPMTSEKLIGALARVPRQSVTRSPLLRRLRTWVSRRAA